ncbi:MAG: response regulator [Lachnospiraceae bacterium]|nr:response regulator [Lachnospiraceae bacterium]
MERIRYLLLTKDEKTKALFTGVFGESIKFFSDVKEMLEYQDGAQVSDGVFFFEYDLIEEQVKAYSMDKILLIENGQKLFIKSVCLVKGTSFCIPEEVTDYVYDVINMEEPEFVLEKKLKNMRSHTLLETIINEVLDMSSFAGHSKMSRERFNLFKMLSYIAAVTYQKCVDKGISYELNIQKDVPEFLIGDRIRLNQIFLNLMTGAVQNSMEGGKVLFDVSSKKIDEKNVSLKFVIEGTGFRLGTTSRVVEASHGTIELEVVDNNTTRITIIFDAEYDAEEEIDKEEAAARFVNMRVACIGKDSRVREHTVEMLEELGFHVDCFNDLEAFRDSFKGKGLAGNLYSVCMVDGDLEKDETIIKQIRSMPGMSSAIIIVNSYNTDRLRMEYLRAGANAVIGKPISKTGIYNTIMQIAGRKISVVKKPIKSGFSFVGKRVMIVDDNELSLEIAKGIIKQSGAIAEVAYNGGEALFKFTTSGIGSYDLILMDIQMPDMDGCEVTKEIRKMDRPDSKVPIFALTSVIEESEHQRALAAGMNDIVMKPLDIKELTGVINGVYN